MCFINTMHNQHGKTRVWVMFLALVVVRRVAGFHVSKVRRLQRVEFRASSTCSSSEAYSRLNDPPRDQAQQCSKLLIHWRGEGVEGYSLQFRHVEFCGALAAVLGSGLLWLSDQVSFQNALNYTGTELKSDLKVTGYNQAMQYLSVPEEIPVSACIQAAQRCSLIHALYRIVAESSGVYDDLSEIAVENGYFDDMKPGGPNAEHTWCVRVRHYGTNADAAKERRYGARARSLTMERQALKELTPVLQTFGGKVDLQQPDCKIYVFDGLYSGEDSVKVLARRLVSGARVLVSSLNPNTRICITNTPLCPVASFTMCNVARIRSHTTILDPYGGSCATLLAAAMIDPSCRTVGIEIAHNGMVCRDDIRKDFASRNLIEPAALICGDSSDARIRAQARAAIGNAPFDCIVTDPPYGIRESTGSIESRPIDELLKMLMYDRNAGTPLLRKGGRLVVFLPHQKEVEAFTDIMPTVELIGAAGLHCELTREQPLNDILSRWLVSFVCIE
jgi:Putative RNA methylase family UPF0020